MNLRENLEAFALRLATEFNTLRTSVASQISAAVGNLPSLTTTAKGNAVAAINEVNASKASASATTTALATKVDKVAGKQLSTEDFATAEKQKLAGIASGATANASDADLRNRSTHTGNQPMSTVVGLQNALDDKVSQQVLFDALTPKANKTDVSFSLEQKVDKSEGKGLSTEDFSTAEKNKLAGIASAATANATDAALRNRETHTGTQPISTVADLPESLADKATHQELTDGLAPKANADAVAEALTHKVDKADGKQLSTEDYSTADKTKVAGIEAEATKNATDADLRARASHTGTQSADTLTDGTDQKAFLATERIKLDGIAAEATKNATDADLRDRTTHTGLQQISTVDGLQLELDDKATHQELADGLAPKADSDAVNAELDTKADADAVDAALLTKVDKVSGKGLSTEDYSSDEKTKLGGVATGATANATNAQLRDRTTHTGTQSADTITDGTTNKSFLATERTKLAGVAAGATANATDADLRDRGTHTGTQSADTVVDGTANKAFTAAEKVKLGGVAAGATANATDVQLRDRATHTGTQSADTVVDGTANKVLTAAKDTKLAGIATAATANDTDANLRARGSHTGTQLAATISDFASTVLAGVLTGLSTATSTAITATDTVLSAAGKLQAQITSAASALAANVRAVALTGLSTATATAITATDTVLSAAGKLQAQITAAAAALAVNVRSTVLAGLTATNSPIVDTDSVLTAFGKAQGHLVALDSGKEPTLIAGTAAQFYRGDKTWATLDKAAVGLPLVDNTADATKAVLTAATLAIARTIALGGAITGTATAFDGSANITITVTGVDLTNAGLSGLLPAAKGGTGLGTFAVGDLFYAATTSTMARLAAVATGNVLRSAGVGTIPTWSKLVLTTDVSGVLPVANGGTGSSTAATGTGGVVLATGPTLASPNFSGSAQLPQYTMSTAPSVAATSGRVFEMTDAPDGRYLWRSNGTRLVNLSAEVGTGDDAVPDQKMLGTGAFIDATYTDASGTGSVAAIAAGATFVTTVAAPGVRAEDFALPPSASVYLDVGLVLSARVIADDSLQITYWNRTGASITPAAHTLYGRVMKRVAA